MTSLQTGKIEALRSRFAGEILLPGDDGVVIDLSPMKAASVDPGARRVTVEGGATGGVCVDFLTADEAGRVMPSGRTGAAGRSGPSGPR